LLAFELALLPLRAAGDDFERDDPLREPPLERVDPLGFGFAFAFEAEPFAEFVLLFGLRDVAFVAIPHPSKSSIFSVPRVPPLYTQ
jgi:hypothetical protein